MSCTAYIIFTDLNCHRMVRLLKCQMVVSPLDIPARNHLSLQLYVTPPRFSEEKDSSHMHIDTKKNFLRVRASDLLARKSRLKKNHQIDGL